jgi:hypothetical protein
MSIRDQKQTQTAQAYEHLKAGRIHMADASLKHAIRYDRRLIAHDHIEKALDANYNGSAAVACAELTQALKYIKLSESMERSDDL